MNAITLLGTLKPTGKSNTLTLVEFLNGYLEKKGITNEIVRLAQHTIGTGIYTKLQEPDDWPGIYSKILDADIILFATPIWWNSHSSELQRIIERLDEVYDIIQNGKPSPLEGKFGGMIITGDRDGAEHITGNIANFFCSLGVTVPAYSTLGVLWEGHGKKEKTTKAELLDYYKKEYARDAQSFASSMAKFSPK
ncbi:MAG: flavodoxin family protein [Flavobacterium sp.]|uniref:flavodoxin family protein n=1 Tax=Flavobacterium sp. TaxID=239 RepID=UPI001217043E|nr:NAD(P)H-dependent oxidoreductase [Flavobacterium sp.]RZJ66293.1 MAG: flavodoxin family protein [Flavobacterium sp.]